MGFVKVGQSIKDKTEGAKVQLSKNACNGNPTSSLSGHRPGILAMGISRGMVGDAFW